MSSKFIYVTSSELGSVSTPDFDETFDFESEPHEMRLHEMIYNKQERLQITPEPFFLLYMLLDDKEGETVMADHLKRIEDNARSEGRRSFFNGQIPGYKNAVGEQIGRKVAAGHVTDFGYEGNDHFPLTKYESIRELVEKMNHFFLEVSPKWGMGDSAIRMNLNNDRIDVIPGVLQQPHGRNIYVFPWFEDMPQLQEALSFPHYDTDEDGVLRRFLDGKSKVIPGGQLNHDEYINHFYTMKCDLIQNECQEKDGYGIVFSWLKDPTRSSAVTHVKNLSDCWLPVKKAKVHEMTIIILRSDNQLASFNDNFTLAVFEIRPRKWKEVST